MAEKLYAPILDGILSAQYGTALKIQFVNNAVVSTTKKMMAKIKTVSTNSLIYSIAGTTSTEGESTFLNIKIPSSLLTSGEFYKIQLAYISDEDNSTIGYYSSVGTFKYLGNMAPSIKLKVPGTSIVLPRSSPITKTEAATLDLSKPFILQDFKCDDDTEKEFSYQINLFLNNELIYSSGEILHNTEEDYDEYYFYDVLFNPDIADELAIEVIVTTNNLYKIIISKFIGYYKQNIPVESTKESNTGIKKVYLQFEDGLNKIECSTSLIGKQIHRWCWEDRKWAIVDTSCDAIAIDRNIEQGKSYSYKIKGKSYVTSRIMADFEDIFLSDDERQFTIRYDPKITSFKEILENNIITTMGSPFPFIIQNGKIRYKEFSLSGLIMSFSDENNLFFDMDKNLVDNNIRTRTFSADTGKNNNTIGQREYLERQFKLEVLRWLNNGKVKLLRTGQEGNYLVKTTDVSFTPEEVSARIFHNFSCTATEVEEYNDVNLKKYIFPEYSTFLDFSLDYTNAYTGFEVKTEDSKSYTPFIAKGDEFEVLKE